jgi:hypothetical protein
MSSEGREQGILAWFFCGQFDELLSRDIGPLAVRVFRGCRKCVCLIISVGAAHKERMCAADIASVESNSIHAQTNSID